MRKLFVCIFYTVLFKNAVATRKVPEGMDCSSGLFYPEVGGLCTNGTHEALSKKPWYLLPHPQLTSPPKLPFLPFFVGLKGAPVHSSGEIDLVKDLVALAHKIAKEFTNPNDILARNTLTTFNTMSRLLKTATETQIANITEQLYVKADSGVDPGRYAAWVVLRDAVVQAGTGPSIISLQNWIRERFVYGEEAAQLISTITNTAEYPTEEFMRAFFSLAKNADTNEQIYVNSSSILAFASLIKKVYVCERSMMKRFPVYSFGRPVPRDSKPLAYVYLPYLATKLNQAIDEEDSHKIQVYIRALGNTAHPKVLQIFGRYLNGEEKVSNFQRLLMVSSLDSMTLVHPNLARSVLYRIYLNSGETSEIRTEAVALLMRTNPPAVMLQRMAEATNFDHSEHVNAAVKSAIESAANIDADDELGNNAKEAVHLLKPRAYGLHYSTNYIRRLNSNDNLGYKLLWNHIQSSGSIFPSCFFFTLRPNLGGFTQRAYKYAWMSSTMDGLANLLAKQILPTKPYPRHADSTWTPANVAKMLGLLQQESRQVEGNLYLTLHGARRFVTFDNHTVEELPKLVKYASSAFRLGDCFNYTKFYNQFAMRIAFPTAAGLPFVFTVDVPTVASAVGSVRLNSFPDLANGSPYKIRPPQSFNWTTDIQALFSSKTESKLGFIAPFSQQHYFAGYEANSHIHLPLHLKGDADLANNKILLKLQPLMPEKYQKIFEFSTMAYTTRHNILKLSPPQLDTNTKAIRIKPPKKQKTFTTGHHTSGFAFEVKGSVPEDLVDVASILQSLKHHDLLSAAIFHDKKSAIEPFVNYSIHFNPRKTTAKSTKIVINYGDVKEYIENREMDNPLENDAVPSVGPGEHKKRIDEILKRSTLGMRDSYAQAMDISAEFEGNRSGIFTLSGAYARSHVSQKARYLFYLSRQPVKTQSTRPLQVALDIKAHLPNVPLGNFEEAVKSDPTSALVARLNFGEKLPHGSEIIIKGHVEKSPKRMDFLLSQPISNQCHREMNESNYLLQACHNVTTRANYMDHIYFRVDYHNVTEEWKTAGYGLYSLIRFYTSPYISENVINQTNPSERIEFDAVFSPELSSFDASLITPAMATELHSVRVNRYFQPALVMHPHYSVWDRIYENIIFSGRTPRCVADNSYTITFDNTTYPMFIGQCWHVMLHFKSEPQPDVSNATLTNDCEEGVSILVREAEGKERDLLIILGENVIRFHAASGNPTGYFIANDQKYDLSEETVGHFEDRSGRTLVQAYKLPTGNMRIFTPEHGMVIFYDGFRVEIQAPSRYRGKLRGLCGTYDGEGSTDFTSPKNCVLKDPLEFGASYAIADGSCQEQIKEFRRKAQGAPCFEQTVVPTNVFTFSDDNHEPFRRQLLTNLKSNLHPKYFKQKNPF